MTLPLADFLTVWTFLAVNILSPGPNVLNTISAAMSSGRPAGLGSALGVGVGISAWCLGMSLGIGAIFAAFPALRGILTVIAIGLLVSFAARYLRNALAGYHGYRRGLPTQPGGQDLADGFRRSLMVSALNPKALTSWLAILTIFPVSRATGADIALLCAGSCALAAGIHAGYALAFSSLPAARFYLRWAWAISGATALFFLGFALKIGLGLN